MADSYPLTCVTGFWRVKNKHDDKYLKWFENTLKINCPYVVFSNKEGIEIIKKFRHDYPTQYIELEVEDFYMNQFKDRMKTDPVHCPSVELNLIWNEKIILLEKAYQWNPYKSDWFCWIDAGICCYRDAKPPLASFPNLVTLAKMPTNRIIYSASATKDPARIHRTSYWHHFAGTAYMIHKSILSTIYKLYKVYADKLIDTNNFWTDQVIWSHIEKDNPELFHKVCDGYGDIIPYLYGS